MGRGENSVLRVGVVGIGFGQQAHVPAFRRGKDCKVTALCASSDERARTVADRLGVPKAYGDWRQLIADPDVDLISVATPPTVQPAIVLGALARGKPVFCEKPLALTGEAAYAMLDAARRSGLAHMVDFEFVTIDEWLQAKRIIDQGQLGQLRHVSVSWHVEAYAHRMGLRSWKTATAATGGGTLASTVSHTFHYLEWLLGPIRKLSARLFTPPGAGGTLGETAVIMCLELDGGASGSVSVCSNAFQGTGHRLEIYGDSGTLILDNSTSDYVTGFKLFHGTRQTDKLEPVAAGPAGQDVKDGRVLAVGRLVDRFLGWVRTGVAASPSFEDGYRVQCLMECARLAHSSGGWVVVPDLERQAERRAAGLGQAEARP